jgi:hypothetical protein
VASASSNLIDIRMKLSGGRAVVSGLTGTRKETEKLGTATSNTSKATKIATGTTGRLTTAYKELGTHAKIALGLVGAGALFGIENAVGKTEELSKATTGLSRNLGFSTKSASEWGAVAQSREISTSALTMSFGSLSTKMVEAARKGGTLLTPFHQLGISQEEVAEGANNFQKGLYTVAEALGKEQGGAKRSAAAKALLGRGYKELLPLFSQGSEGLKEQLHWADEFGATLSNTANGGFEDMITAQRKNKVAMLGLQVSITKLVTPAIELGDDQLQDFIKTLNDPKLNDQQKIEKIGEQFEQLGFHLIAVVEKALPKIAEVGARLGEALAKAVATAFLHANLAGKLAIGLYVFSLFGGKELALAGAKKVGGMIGTEVGLGVATGAVGAFVAYEIWEHMSERSKLGIEKWVNAAGEMFVNGLIHRINQGIHLINDALNDANAFSILGVSAPQIGEIGNVEFGGKLRERETKLNAEEGFIEGPGGKLIKPKSGAELEAARGKHRKKATPQSLTLPQTAFGGGHGTTHVHLYLARNDKEIASAVLGPAQRRAALK